MSTQSHIPVLVAVLVIALLLLMSAHLRLRHQNRQLALKLSQSEEDSQRDREALARRVQLDSDKDEFVSTISHELRTPLTSIHGALGLLSSGVLGELNDRAAHLVRIANNNTDRLVRLINNTLDLERIDCGQAPPVLSGCNLQDLAQQATDVMGPMAENAGIMLVLFPPEEQTTLAFEGDADRIVQVICNLLSNAIKFSPREAEVHLRVGVENDVVTLRVSDTGRGVPSDKLETIFDRFTQVDAGDSRQKGGTGLGLAICRAIVTQHHGTIYAESNDSQSGNRPGVTLVVHLPRTHVSEEMSSLTAASPA